MRHCQQTTVILVCRKCPPSWTCVPMLDCLDRKSHFSRAENAQPKLSVSEAAYFGLFSRKCR